MAGETYYMTALAVVQAHQDPRGKSMWAKPCGCKISYANADLVAAGSEAWVKLYEIVQHHECPHSDQRELTQCVDAPRQKALLGAPGDPSKNQS